MVRDRRTEIRDTKREREVRDVWVDTGHGGNRHRGLMRGEPEEKASKDRQREAGRGRGEKEGVSDRWCSRRGEMGEEREDGTLENKSSKQTAKNRVQV